MGIFFAVLAALLASVSNFFLRRSIDAGGSSNGYLCVQLTFSFFVMIALNPVRTGDFGWSQTALILGLFGGLILGLMMWALGKTLERGPSGLSFAILNTSSVMPAIVLALLFGASFNHPYSLVNGLGSILVVIGLFWAGWTSQKNPNKAIWALFAAAIFLAHTLFLLFLQWWAMILKSDLPVSRLLPIHLDSRNIQWFMPAIFFAAALFQCIAFYLRGGRLPETTDLKYGILGGVANGACTFFLILAPQVANAWENAMIFPIFSVGIILLCNAWAQFLYKEKINWLANLLALGGLILGTR